MITNPINFTKSYNRLKVKIMWQSIQTINKEKYIYNSTSLSSILYHNKKILASQNKSESRMNSL